MPSFLRCLRGGKVIYDNSLLQFYQMDRFTDQIPTGTVVMFDATCPAGWTRLSDIDDKFVKAAAAYSASGGGNADHIHTISNHTHTWSGNVDNTDPTNRAWNAGALAQHTAANHNHTLSITNVADGTHSTGNGTNSNERIQPWVKLIFYKKLRR